MSQDEPAFDVILPRPRGFCAGVERAVQIVELALEQLHPPIYVRREIVHNRAVVERFRARGVVFVDSLDEVPAQAVCVFSAHGVAPDVRAAADARGLQVIDATCPLVTKVHVEVLRHARAGDTILLIGHEGHDEVIGTMGHARDQVRLVGDVHAALTVEVPDPQRVAYVTQTTLSVDETAGIVRALRGRFPAIEGPKTADICYATQNRQDAVKALVLEEGIELLLVVGSENSSNSQRLVEVAQSLGARGQLVDAASDVDPAWLRGVRRVGLTAGASAPEDLVQGVAARLAALGGRLSERELIPEDVTFPLPPQLAPARNRSGG